MSFKSVVHAIVEDLEKVGPLVPAYGQLIQFGAGLASAATAEKVGQAEQVVYDRLGALSKLVIDAQTMGDAVGLTGEQKRNMIATQAIQIFADLPLLKGHTPDDAEDAKAKVAALMGAFNDVLKCYKA
jgi:hypothetical protein